MYESWLWLLQHTLFSVSSSLQLASDSLVPCYAADRLEVNPRRPFGTNNLSTAPLLAVLGTRLLIQPCLFSLMLLTAAPYLNPIGILWSTDFVHGHLSNGILHLTCMAFVNMTLLFALVYWAMPGTPSYNCHQHSGLDFLWLPCLWL